LIYLTPSSVILYFLFLFAIARDCSVIAVPEDVAGQRSRTSDETEVGVDDKRRPAKEGKKKGGANGGKDKKNKKSKDKDKDKDSANGGNRKSKGDSVKPGKEVKTKSAKREGGNEVKKNKGALPSTSVCTPNDFQW
jgi:hypothetical protein